MVLRRIDPVSCAKVSAALYALLGLVAGLIMTLVFVAAGTLSPEENFTPLFGAVFGVGSVVFFPFFYGAMGFLFGLLGAWLYNILADRIGGIEVEFE